LANPQYEEIPLLDPEDFFYLYKTYFCADGGLRGYDFIPLPCIEQFILFLQNNIGFSGLTVLGQAFLEASAIGPVEGLYGQGSDYVKFDCVDGSYHVYYPTFLNPFPLNPEYTLVVPPL
jgi:hypothetical protein